VWPIISVILGMSPRRVFPFPVRAASARSTVARDTRFVAGVIVRTAVHALVLLIEAVAEELFVVAAGTPRRPALRAAKSRVEARVRLGGGTPPSVAPVVEAVLVPVAFSAKSA
jgi:hypothetical protein